MFWNITRDVELLPWSGSVLAKCLSYCLDWPNWPKKTKKGSLLHVWSLLLRIVFCLADLCVDLGLSQSGRNSISSKFLKIYLNVSVRLIDTVLMARRVSLTWWGYLFSLGWSLFWWNVTMSWKVDVYITTCTLSFHIEFVRTELNH